MVWASTKSICLDRHPNPKGDAPVAGRAQGPDTPLFTGSLAPAGRAARDPRRRAYSAAFATRAFSASSKASIRRAVAIGDFVKRASML